jgi:hypothetical protein
VLKLCMEGSTLDQTPDSPLKQIVNDLAIELPQPRSQVRAGVWLGGSV